MKKLLTLTALIAGIALLAGCMNKPVIEDELILDDVMIEEVIVEEVVVEEAIVEEVEIEDETPEAIAE